MADAPDTTKPDYRSTVFLPQTDFPMKAGLPQKEPAIARALGSRGPLPADPRGARRAARSSSSTTARPTPTATSTSAMRSTTCSRTWSSAPRPCSARTRPTCPAGTATACRSSGRSRSSIARRSSTRTRCRSREFRAECRAYAQHWVDVQREQLKRLGISADWDKPYLTMDFERRGDDRLRAVQVRRERPALPRRQAGDVVAGREDRAGRGRDRI